MKTFCRAGFFLFLLGACVQPVKRDDNSARPVAKAAIANPDLVKKRLWILEFTEKSGAISKEFKGVRVRDVFQKALIRALSAPASPYLTDVTDDGGMIEAGIDSASSAEDIQKAAHSSGVSGFLKGTITNLNIESKGGSEGLLHSATQEIHLSVEFEMYDAISGRKIYSGNAHQTSSETKSGFFVDSTEGFEGLSSRLETAAQEVADKVQTKLASVADKLGWRGRVVKLDGPRIYLNAGRKTGLQLGDVVKVIDRPKEVIDPQTGAVVGEAPGRLKATLKVIDHFGVDGAMAVLLSGGGVVPGDSVELN